MQFFSPITVLAALLGVTSLSAQTAADPSADGPILLDRIIVNAGRYTDLVGATDSATAGTVGRAELVARPILRPGELMETIPGVIITQHSGGGKANQYFLRGFNLDHGTDFATAVDGVPVNLPTHAHGQGYTDLNWLIPEAVVGVNYQKGPYYASVGDFGTAGAADITYASVLPASIARFEIGSHNYERFVATGTPQLGKEGRLLYAVELAHADGAWTVPNDYRKINGVLRYVQGTPENHWLIAATSYAGKWLANDQVPQRAIESGLIGRFGSLDSTTGGKTGRHSLYAEWHAHTFDVSTEILVYGVKYDLDLYSNFTYFIDDTDGDQIRQRDDRIYGGLNAKHTRRSEFSGHATETSLGLQFRDDAVDVLLARTHRRAPVGTIRADEVNEATLAPWLENKTTWSEKIRTVAGARYDTVWYDVQSDNPLNIAKRSGSKLSPKLSLIFGPWADTELYLQGGYGFHSADARGTTARVEPVTGEPAVRPHPLVRSQGVEFGLRTRVIKGLQSTVSFWLLDSDSENVFAGDSGTTEDSGRPGRRYGVEFANFYAVNKWITLDADVSLSQARFTDTDPAGDRIPDAVRSVVAAGVTLHDLGPWHASLRARYFGSRDLIEDGSERSASSLIFNLRIAYTLSKTWELSAEVLNLFDRKVNDQEYLYSSRLRGEPVGPEDDGGYLDHHVHAGEPLTVRFGVTARF